MCSLTGDIITLFAHPFNNYPSQPKSMRPSSCARTDLGFKQQVWFGVYQCICANRWTTIFAGFWLGIFATHKTWTSLAFWLRIDDKTGTLAYPVWCIVWVVQTQLFAENSNRGRKVSPEKSKSQKVHIPGDFCSKSRKNRKIRSRKVEKSKSSHSRRFLLEKSKNSKNPKSRKVEKFTFQEISARKVEKFEKFEKSKSSHSNTFQEISARKVEKNEKFEKSKSRKLFDFLTFCEKFCNFRAVRLPARGALRGGAHSHTRDVTQ